ncbi:hypothetical protein L3X38_011481 [Prunus dulcis]|uniref:Uncharacterized protein n=1 Tax=Prunus dulcis TaxID=3755 RepID=A0AAD4WHL5_PRUDU|nr:hypothetical protein L3X38_011481 [Prunus dulcis]
MGDSLPTGTGTEMPRNLINGDGFEDRGGDGDVPLKWPIVMKREIEIIESVRSKIVEEYHFFKTLLDFKNLFKSNVRRYEEAARVLSASTEEERWSLEAEDEAAASSRGAFGSGGDGCRSAAGEKDGDDRDEAAAGKDGTRIGRSSLLSSGCVSPKCCRLRIAEAGKAIQDADCLSEENAAKNAELSSKLAEAERAVVCNEKARATAEVAKDVVIRSHAAEVEVAETEAVAKYRSSDEFTLLLDKEVMDQYVDLGYWFKRYNADKKVNLNFLWILLHCPKGSQRRRWSPTRVRMLTSIP